MALLGAPYIYIYDVSRLRVNWLTCVFLILTPFRVSLITLMLGHVILAIMTGVDHLNSGVEEISLALELASLNLNIKLYLLLDTYLAGRLCYSIMQPYLELVLNSHRPVPPKNADFLRAHPYFLGLNPNNLQQGIIPGLKQIILGFVVAVMDSCIKCLVQPWKMFIPEVLRLVVKDLKDSFTISVSSVDRADLGIIGSGHNVGDFSSKTNP